MNVAFALGGMAFPMRQAAIETNDLARELGKVGEATKHIATVRTSEHRAAQKVARRQRSARKSKRGW